MGGGRAAVEGPCKCAEGPVLLRDGRYVLEVRIINLCEQVG